MLLFSFLFLFSGVVPASSGELTARQIAQKAQDRDDGDNETSEMEMLLYDKHNNLRTRHIKSFRKDFGKDSYQLLFFLSPADVKDTGFLTYDYDDAEKDDDQWLYLPALGKTKRIASSDKDGSFMGSDFSYADMTDRNLPHYNFKKLKDQVVNGAECWLIESTPKKEFEKQEVNETGYTKSLIFVRKDNFVVVRAIHFLKEGKKLKYMSVDKLSQIDGIWVAEQITMVTKKRKRTLHKTVLSFKNIRFHDSLDEGLFTIRRLEKGL